MRRGRFGLVCWAVALVWTHKFFFTASGVAQFLNQLGEARSLEAHVSQDRGGFYVFYRIEEDVPEKAR